MSKRFLPTESGMAMTKEYEGWRHKPYQDPGGSNESVGWGFNVVHPDVQTALKDNFMSKEEAEPIFQRLYGEAIDNAIDFVGIDTFNKLNDAQKEVIIDMAYNLGGEGLGKFKGMQSAVIAGDYPRAAMEMQYRDPSLPESQRQLTPWFEKTGRRARNHIQQILGR